jgi:hypothetical protein
MEEEARQAVLEKAASRLEAGEEPRQVLSDAFAAGRAYGVIQGHCDRDAGRAAAFYGGGFSSRLGAVPPSWRKTGRAEMPPAQAARQSLMPVEEPSHRHNRRGAGYTCYGCPGRAAERYAQQAKARLAARIGEDLAEEFTSAAASTQRDIVNTAELMAVAYEMGRQAVSQPCEPEDQPLAGDEPGQAVQYREAERGSMCVSPAAVNGQHDWDSYHGRCANRFCQDRQCDEV